MLYNRNKHSAAGQSALKTKQTHRNRNQLCGYQRQGMGEGGAKKNLPAMQEMRIQSLGLENHSLAEGKATHSSILARKIPWTEALGKQFYIEYMFKG